MDLNSKKVDEIFSNLSQKLREKELANSGEKTSQPCCCNNQLFYLKQAPDGRIFDVCPKCNPRLSCNICGQSGHIERLNPTTDAYELVPFGCDCVITEQRVAMLNNAKIPEKYLNAEFTFENIQFGYSNISKEMADKFSQNQFQIFNFCEAAHDLSKHGVSPSSKYFLTLLGPVGTGKTYFAVCALKQLIWKFGHSGKFIDFQALLQQLRDTYSRKNPEEEIMQPLRKIDILVIDEFGKGRTENEWELEKLDDLVNSRYNAGKITIITTNYLPPEIHAILNKKEFTESKKGSSEIIKWHNQQYSQEQKTNPTNPYWNTTLLDRIGERMYDRILEVSEFVDFIGIPSFRRRSADNFIERYLKSVQKQED